ncbi:MAG TPA: L-threonylcarbamoyladenylate synthase [Bacillota bacterium]|nr:L-threonylcarbamoyladenylate synthase [Bacillota bacterium]
METVLLKVNPDCIQSGILLPAAASLQSGDLVAFPTETVYGLGASYRNEPALRRIFETKGRPGDNPLIVHIWNPNQLDELVLEIDPKFEKLIAAFWPGPLTLVFPKQATVSPLVTAGLTTVAVRMPSHPVARELLRLTAIPVAAPSANLSGKPSPTRGEHVMADFNGKIPWIIDAGPCNAGIESTVLMLDAGKPLILRPGSVTREMLEEVLQETVAVSNGEAQRPSAPGMKYRHYAPKAPVVLVEGPKEAIVRKINELLQEDRLQKKVVVIGSAENLTKYHTKLVLDLGSEQNLELAAMRLYDLLRACDELGADQILIEGVDQKGIGAALTNRLHKASGGNVIDVS